MPGNTTLRRAIQHPAARGDRPGPAGTGAGPGRVAAKRRIASVLAAALLSAGALLGTAAASGAAEPGAGDPEAGRRVFGTQCRACHTIGPGGRPLVGPSLHGVFGRPAAAIRGFRYSKAMREKAEAGLVWNRETLRAYLASPRAAVPGTAMTYVGLRNERQLDDLLAFLERAAAAAP